MPNVNGSMGSPSNNVDIAQEIEASTTETNPESECMLGIEETVLHSQSDNNGDNVLNESSFQDTGNLTDSEVSEGHSGNVHFKDDDSVVTFTVKPSSSFINIQISPKGVSLPPFPSIKVTNPKKVSKDRSGKLDILKISEAIASCVKNLDDVNITGSGNSLSPIICQKLGKKNCERNWIKLSQIWIKNVKNIQGLVARKLNTNKKDEVPITLKPGVTIGRQNSGTIVLTKENKLLTFYQNGVVDKPSYYNNPNSDIDVSIGFYYRVGLSPILLTSKSYKSLSNNNALSDQCIDGCIASLINAYKTNVVLHLTVFETHTLFTSTFTDNFYIFQLNLERYDNIIMPYADGSTCRGDGHKHWCVLFICMKTKEIYSYSTFPTSEVSSKSFKYFLKFLERKNSLNDVEYDTKKWCCKIVKHPFQMKINDSGVYLLKFIESMLQKKPFQSINTSDYRFYLQKLCLKASDSVKGRCLYCGNEETGYYEKFKCKLCHRFIHLNGTCVRYFNFPVSNIVTDLENFVCALCAIS